MSRRVFFNQLSALSARVRRPELSSLSSCWSVDGRLGRRSMTSRSSRSNHTRYLLRSTKPVQKSNAIGGVLVTTLVVVCGAGSAVVMAQCEEEPVALVLCEEKEEYFDAPGAILPTTK